MHFKGRLRTDDGNGIPVELSFEDIFIQLDAETGSLGRWRLDEVGLTRKTGNRFELVVGDESLEFLAEDPLSFAYEGMAFFEDVSSKLHKKRKWRRRKPPEAPVEEVSGPGPISRLGPARTFEAFEPDDPSFPAVAPVSFVPEPVVVELEPRALEPEPEPVVVELEPTALEPEPEPVVVEPEPVVVEPVPEPVVVEAEPPVVEAEPVVVEVVPEPTVVEAEPAVAVESFEFRPVPSRPPPGSEPSRPELLVEVEEINAVESEPELVVVEAEPEPEPVVVEAEPEPEPEPLVVEAEPEQVVVEAEPEQVVVEAEPEPEPEPEPLVVEAEPEPEPVVVELEPGPTVVELEVFELEPVVVEVEPKPELEPVVVEAEPKPELEPVVVEVEPEPELVEVILDLEPAEDEPTVVVLNEVRSNGRSRRHAGLFRRRRVHDDHEHAYSQSRSAGITRRVCDECGHVSFDGEDTYQNW